MCVRVCFGRLRLKGNEKTSRLKSFVYIGPRFMSEYVRLDQTAPKRF